MQNTHELVRSNVCEFSLVYETYRKRMYAYGLAIGFCENLCKDAIQDVFCSLYINRENLDHIEKIEPYLLHCLKNRLFDMYKEQKRMNCTCYDNLIIDQDDDSIGKIINEENELLMKEEIERLLKRLNSKQKKIVYCRYHHNLKFDEIATVMDMSADAVKKMLYRSLKLLEQDREITLQKLL